MLPRASAGPRARILLAALLAGLASMAVAFTKPDQLELLTQFRDAMLSRPVHKQWTQALATCTCPTAPNNTNGGDCDPCGAQTTWGNWDHVSCRGKEVAFDKYEVPGTGDVTNLHITDQLLEGPVPIEQMCVFKALREFDLDGGQLTGGVPTQFAQCFPDLREIDLSYNLLTGTVPPEVTATGKTLQEFKVEHNNLTGTIPAEFGSMEKLIWLRFANNRMSGEVPQALAASASHLYQLQLDENDFSGNLYALSNHSMVNFNAADNAKMCGMVPIGLRFAHGFNFHGTGLGLPCPAEITGGWADLTETL